MNFFKDAQSALLETYRPCERCHPLSTPTGLSADVKLLIEQIEKDPKRKWSDKDFERLSIHANTSRRQFKKQFGMTFIEYSRIRRLGVDFKQIRDGQSLIQAQLTSGFESGNGFRDAFSRIMGESPSKNKKVNVLYSAWLETKLGSMLAMSDESSIYLLEFVDRRVLENEIMMLRKKLNAIILPKKQTVVLQLQLELDEYFFGERLSFDVPIHMIGSNFQRLVWEQLSKIPIGHTKYYKELACSVSNPNASQVVANSNGRNQLSLLVPCHRIVNSDGGIGGYGGGIERKKWLLHHEKDVLNIKVQSKK